MIIQNNNADTAELILDASMNAITSMFKNPDLYNWDGGADEAKIQAFMRGMRTHQFGNIGQNNELPVAELRYDLTCDLGVITYDPVVDDDFITLHLETRYPPGVSDGTPQVVVQYDIPQGYLNKLSGQLRVKVNAIKVP